MELSQKETKCKQDINQVGEQFLIIRHKNNLLLEEQEEKMYLKIYVGRFMKVVL